MGVSVLPVYREEIGPDRSRDSEAELGTRTQAPWLQSWPLGSRAPASPALAPSPLQVMSLCHLPATTPPSHPPAQAKALGVSGGRCRDSAPLPPPRSPHAVTAQQRLGLVEWKPPGLGDGGGSPDPAQCHRHRAGPPRTNGSTPGAIDAPPIQRGKLTPRQHLVCRKGTRFYFTLFQVRVRWWRRRPVLRSRWKARNGAGRRRASLPLS